MNVVAIIATVIGSAVALFGAIGSVLVWAIKTQIGGVSVSLNARIDSLDSSLNARVDGLGSSLNARIDALDRSLTAEINGLRAEINGLRVETNARLTAVERMLGLSNAS